MKPTVKHVIASTLLVSGLVFAGCAKPPDVEMQSALQALEAARTAGATEYAGPALAAAEQAQRALEEELKTQEGKFALFRKYDQATTLAADALAKATAASQAASEGKARARSEAEQMIASVQNMLQETEAMIATAPTGKGSAMDLAVLRSDLVAATSALGEATQLVAQEKYMDAKSRVQAAMNGVATVKSTIEQAQQMKAASSRH